MGKPWAGRSLGAVGPGKLYFCFFSVGFLLLPHGFYGVVALSRLLCVRRVSALARRCRSQAPASLARAGVRTHD